MQERRYLFVSEQEGSEGTTDNSLPSSAKSVGRVYRPQMLVKGVVASSKETSEKETL